MTKIKILLAVTISILMLAACTKKELGTEYDPPADHIISQDGYMHKTGLNDPTANCINCHGADLTGGNTGVSCFECHGTKW